mmetsp:Transcript_115915/g.201229  ORF Transcript_115915/g.201229 Transcript_115915/m.201229 type:complete len:169 (+) Transcript_115915:1645-2151(+)
MGTRGGNKGPDPFDNKPKIVLETKGETIDRVGKSSKKKILGDRGEGSRKIPKNGKRNPRGRTKRKNTSKNISSQNINQKVAARKETRLNITGKSRGNRRDHRQNRGRADFAVRIPETKRAGGGDRGGDTRRGEGRNLFGGKNLKQIIKIRGTKRKITNIRNDPSKNSR